MLGVLCLSLDFVGAAACHHNILLHVFDCFGGPVIFKCGDFSGCERGTRGYVTLCRVARGRCHAACKRAAEAGFS
jgi:hypothetical protein